MFDLPVPEGWRLVKLSDLGEVNRGRSRHRPRDAAHLYGGPYPFVQTGDVKASQGRVTSYTQTYSEDGLAQSRLWPKDTMCITIAANIAETGILQFPACFPDSVIGFIPDKSKCNVYFIEYVFRMLRRRIQAQATGSVQDNINLQTLERLLFPVPELDEQNRIADVLCSFDNKIELNRQTNQTLEHIAQAIFKSWFVDFEPTRAKIAAKQAGQDPERAAMAAISGLSITDAAGAPLDELDQLSPEQQEQLKTTAALFPDALVDSELGEIPEGWEVSELGQMLEFNPKRTLKKGVMAPYLDMKNVPTQGHLADDVYLREMASGTKFINGDTLLARITPCLENGKTAYVDFLEEGQVAWGSTEYIVMRPKGGRPMSLGYIIARLDYFRSKAIQTMTGTSGRQRANAKALSEQAWVNYPLELLDAFDRIAGAYLAKAKENGDENKTLSELRDVLLPQLLSGDLPVGNKEIA